MPTAIQEDSVPNTYSIYKDEIYWSPKTFEDTTEN